MPTNVFRSAAHFAAAGFSHDRTGRRIMIRRSFLGVAQEVGIGSGLAKHQHWPAHAVRVLLKGAEKVISAIMSA